MKSIKSKMKKHLYTLFHHKATLNLKRKTKLGIKVEEPKVYKFENRPA